jgi:hypothetical protein
MSGTLSRRLERLETRFVPATAATRHTIVFVDADGTKTGSIVLHHGGPNGLRNCVAGGGHEDSRSQDSQA